jgi:TRAP-type C4-dicarboxylate transport system permease small subunit
MSNRHTIVAIVSSLLIHAAFLLILSLSWIYAPAQPKKNTTETIRVELIETKQPSDHPLTDTW